MLDTSKYDCPPKALILNLKVNGVLTRLPVILALFVGTTIYLQPREVSGVLQD